MSGMSTNTASFHNRNDDAHSMFQVRVPNVPRPNVVRELVYADVALLPNGNLDIIQDLMSCVGECARHYGLTLNWRKVEVKRCRAETHLVNGAGKGATGISSLVDLRALLSADGWNGADLNRIFGTVAIV
eukprot:5040690-Pyramimonas_sp.AAC.1